MTHLEQLAGLKTRPMRPGEVLADLLDTYDLTQSELAQRLGVGRLTISQLVNGHRTLTPEMAQRLGRFFGNGAGVWMRLQQQVDLWDTLHADLGDYESIEPLVPDDGELVAA